MRDSTADPTQKTARLISVAAATAIALSCGTNYAFSAWEPQFASRLNLSATEANLIGNFGNIGMYAMGIPGGILIDSRGPRWGVLVGLVGLAVGYFSLHSAYEAGSGEGAMALPWLCFFSLLTGIASCTAFSAALKVAATNWPNHRGTATGIPLSAFGLSAFFWTTLSGIVFGDDTSGYLMLVAGGTTSLVAVGMVFLRTVPVGELGYEAVGGQGRSESGSSKLMPRLSHSRHSSAGVERATEEETASLVSSTPGDLESSDLKTRLNPHTSPTRPDITGFAILRTLRFYQLWMTLGIGCGIGLMTINNIGNNTQSLWRQYSPSTPAETVKAAQMSQVGILSLASFAGRLSSGIGSDALVHRGASRFWTLVVSATIFTLAQIVAMLLQNPNYLFLLSGLTGLAYGQLFGVFPALTADAFGTSGMAINWGVMTLAPVVSGNFFNLAYGKILDGNSEFVTRPDGSGEDRVCDLGRGCYAEAYWITFSAAVFAVGWCLWCIRSQKGERLREERERGLQRVD